MAFLEPLNILFKANIDGKVVDPDFDGVLDYQGLHILLSVMCAELNSTPKSRGHSVDLFFEKLVNQLDPQKHGTLTYGQVLFGLANVRIAHYTISLDLPKFDH